MNEEAFNMSIRRFLKELGVSSQREIEKAVRDGLESGALKGSESLHAQAVVTVAGLKLRHEISGEIKLG